MLTEGVGEVTLRRAMELLNYGPVGTYFAYRWCSPTFRTGLNMLALSKSNGSKTVEYACGIGHFLRELEWAGQSVIGLDIVFSKLWLARRFLGVRGVLVCGDVEQSELLSGGVAGAGFCHDALYFFRDKTRVLHRLRAAVALGGSVAIGHAHTDRDRHAAGHPLSLAEYRNLTAETVYDDASLVGRPAAADTGSAAVAWIEHARSAEGETPLSGYRRGLALSPLIGADGVKWPSDAYREEYTADALACGWGEDSWKIDGERVRTLYRTWRAGTDLREVYSPAELDTMVRRQLLLNLPKRW